VSEVTPSRDHRLGQVVRRLGAGQLAVESPSARELPFTAVFAIACVFTLFEGAIPRPGVVTVSAVVVALVQAVSVMGRWHRLPRWVPLVFPLLQIAALVAFAYGSGHDSGLFAAMLFLPVISLALQAGYAGVALGTLATAVLVALPLDGSLPADERIQRRIGGIIIVLCVFLVGAGTSAVTTRLRAQALALTESRDRATALGARIEAARALLASIVDAATEQLVAAVDGDGRILLASPGARTLLKTDELMRPGASILPYFSGAELRDAAVERGLGDSPADRLRTIVGSAADGHTERREWTLTRPDGTSFPAEVTVLRRTGLDEPGQDGYLLVATDITERRQAERLQDEFIGLVSHELRTPLASILGYVDLLRLDDSLSVEQIRQLDVIERNARRLLRLVEDLLLSVQVVAGTFELRGERVDVREIARRSVATLAPSADAAGVVVTVDAPEAVPLESDAERLDQIVENLVANAIKFSPRDTTVTVSVRPEEGAEGGRRARILVTDHGEGMTPDVLAKVTQRFFRADEAHRRKVRGIGLGLSVTEAIVTTHGGTIAIESSPGEGTAVTVDLPDLPTPPPEPASTSQTATSTE
jgi:signal transduction histidine kinase